MSSAVQTGTSAGGFEETPIESKESDAVNRRNAHKPLFEQLRVNQEDDQEKKDEMQREIMLNTCALDDEDVAHLDSIERQRTDREQKIQERTLNELDNFRAAKALRQQAALVGDYEDGNDIGDDEQGTVTDATREIGVKTLGVKEKVAHKPALSLPVIKVKKRKRRINPTDTKANNIMHTKQKATSKSEVKKIEANETTSKMATEMLSLVVKKNDSGGLGSLLSGYGSSSDED